ncbi:MAG TPA: ATP-dependent sacrificial sulfur transferase LarE [Candidatus Scatomorpha stercorigallinarum]|nr:ATP-dependent sacrificial sulfur transferase LarE [Candidatus Scatomorpha stercorigallinarum]
MELREFFERHPKCALAFSGGTDSALLLCEARRLGADVKAYFVKGPFQPQFELEDARRLAKELGAEMEVIETDVLALPEVAENGPRRCYYCKRAIFSLIFERARRDGYDTVIDGTNASDQVDDRPGMQAIAELGVLSPLRMCGVTKAQVRELSAEAGLFTARKPSYACLATRVPTGTAITREALEKVERGEEALREMGFSDLRLRLEGTGARLELPAAQLPAVVQNRERVLKALLPSFSRVTVDLAGRTK